MKNANLYQLAVKAPGGVDEDFLNRDKARTLKAQRGGVPRFIPTAYESVNALIVATGVRILTDSPTEDSASPYTDGRDMTVHMPYPDAFNGPAAYAHTVLHELSHWSRFNFRPHDPDAGYSQSDMAGYSPKYAMEELAAEICAGMLADKLGVAGQEFNQLGYLHNWISSLDTAAWARDKSDRETFEDWLFTSMISGNSDHHEAHDEAFTRECWDEAVADAEERFAWLMSKVAR